MGLSGSNNNGLHEFDRFRLDTSSRVLWSGNDIVDLPPKAIDVLCALVERNGEVVAKGELIDLVWAESFVEESNLTHQIYELRKAFKEHGCETDLIQTVPRRGYRFVAEIKESFDGGEEVVVERRSISRTLIAELIDKEPDEIVPRPPINVAPLPMHLPPAPRSWSRFVTALLFGMILLAGGFAIWKWGRSTGKISLAEVRSIAVLPLKQFEGGESDSSLGLRIADSLITRLGSLKQISVRPTSSIIKFTGEDVDPVGVGRSLEVDAVIEGRIHRQGDDLRLNLQMISVATGEQIWSGQFDGNANSLLGLQDVVGRSLVNGVDIASSRNEETAKPTENADAYDKYLLGRYHWNTRTEEGFTKAISFFEQAVTLDPQFSEAFAGLGDAYIGLYDYGIRPADECIPKARAALNRSILIRPESAEAYSTLSAIQFLYDRDFPAAERSIKRSIDLKPNYATARLRYGWYLTSSDRFDEAKEQLDIARSLDPTAAIVQANTGYLAMVSGRVDEAEAIFNKVIESNPTFSLPHWYLGGINFQRGDRDVMFKHYLRAFEIDDSSAASAKVLDAWQSKGEKAALTTWLNGLEDAYKTDYFPPSNIALIAAISGDKQKTLHWLEESEKIRDPWLLQIKYDHEYDFVRDDPRFTALLKRLGV